MTSINVGRALTFGFEDSEWLAKLAVGALVVLVGIVFSLFLVGVVIFFLLSGYMVAIARAVAAGSDRELPSWDNLGELFKDGFFVSLASFVWNIPALILSIPSLVPVFLLGDSNGDVVSVVLVVISSLAGCVLILYAIFYALISPIIIWQVADKGTLAAAFDVHTIFRILKAQLGNIIIIVVTMVVVDLLAVVIGTLLCGLGVILTLVWTIWVQGHLVGQLGALVRGAEAVPTPTLQEA